MRLISSFILLFFLAISTAWAIDIESLGTPLSDDSKSMYDRYVYFDEAESIKNTPLDIPVLSKVEVGDFAVQAVSNALMMSHKDYQQRLTDIEQYFTPQGRQQYQDMLAQVQLIETIKSQYYNLSAALNGVAMVGTHGSEEGGPYRWQVVVPLILTYSREVGAQIETYPFEMMVRVNIERVEEGATWHNLKITSWEIVQS